jgi:uncharacterized membrane protein YhaH (DUF805 family)
MNPLFQLAEPALYDGASTEMLAGLLALGMVFFVVFLIVAIIAYVYFGLAIMKLAQRLKVEPAWLAWVPIGNVYLLLKMGKQPWWPMLLLLAMIIPLVNIVAMIVFVVYLVMATWKICEARAKPGWWSLLTFIPLVGPIWQFIMFGILAWGKD